MRACHGFQVVGFKSSRPDTSSTPASPSPVRQGQLYRQRHRRSSSYLPFNPGARPAPPAVRKHLRCPGNPIPPPRKGGQGFQPVAQSSSTSPAAGPRERSPGTKAVGEGVHVAAAADAGHDGRGGSGGGEGGEVPPIEQAAKAVPVGGVAPLHILLNIDRQCFHTKGANKL